MRQRIVFWLVLLAATSAGVWWLLYVPYRPDRVLAAIPAEATLVSVQMNLAGQLDALSRNPVILNALLAGGIQNGDIAGVATNPVLKKWAARLASDQSVLAYVPSMGPQHKPAIVFASWIGNQSRLLRWQMAWIKSRDVQPIPLNAGRLTLWRIKTDLEKSDLRISVALSEGLILGCLSSDPVAVRSLLETAEGIPGRLSLLDTDKPARSRALLHGIPPQWGWFLANGSLVAYQLALGNGPLTLDFTGKHSLPPSIPLSGNKEMKTANNFTATTSDLSAILPLSWLQAMTSDESSSLWIQTFRQLAEPNRGEPDALAFLALLDQNHSGRLRGPLGSSLGAFIKGVKTPTLLIGMQLGTAQEANRRVQNVIDGLNSRYNLTLKTTPWDMAGRTGIILIEESRKNFYGSFEPGERVAYAMADDWFILASNAQILKQLLESTPTVALPVTDSAGASPSATVHLQLDSLSQTVKTTSGVLKLAALFNTSQEVIQARDSLNRAGTWASVLGSFGEAHASMSTSGSVFRIHLVIGKP